MRAELNTLAEQAGILTQSIPSIPHNADVDNLVTAIQQRATRELTCYIRLVATRVTGGGNVPAQAEPHTGPGLPLQCNE